MFFVDFVYEACRRSISAKVNWVFAVKSANIDYQKRSQKHSESSRPKIFLKSNEYSLKGAHWYAFLKSIRT